MSIRTAVVVGVAILSCVALASSLLGLCCARTTAWQVIEPFRTVTVGKNTESVKATFVIRNCSALTLRVLGTRTC
jgi:hypothetical protein